MELFLGFLFLSWVIFFVEVVGVGGLEVVGCYCLEFDCVFSSFIFYSYIILLVFF